MKVTVRRLLVYAAGFVVFWISFPSLFLLTGRHFEYIDTGEEHLSESHPALLDPFCANFVRDVTSEFYLNYTAHHLFFDTYPRHPIKSPPTLIHFAINSAPKNFQARRTIRATWKRLLSTTNSAACSGSLKFYVGKTKHVEHAKWLEREVADHPDDMVVIDFCDAYENLSLKTANIMRYVHENYADTEWVVKVDDDMMPNIPGFYQCFPKVIENNVDIYGWISIDAVPVRGDKYQVSLTRYSGTYFPPFTHGPAYAVRISQLGKLLEAAKMVPVLNLEDVWFTGMLAQEVGMKRKNVTHFLSMFRRPREFDIDMDRVMTKALFFHHIPARIIRKAWANLPQSCEKARKYDCLDFMHGFGGAAHPEIL